MKHRSTTPWKKSRTYGDIYGGRLRRRMTDNIFARAHSLQRPGPEQALPLLIQDNPSREFFFPVSVEECATALRALPTNHTAGITHIWLRRRSTRTASTDASLAEFICGSGVRVIVLYPWRTDGRRYLGRSKPAPQQIAMYLRAGAKLGNEHGQWYVEFSEADLRRFYIEHLFCHEVGHTWTATCGTGAQQTRAGSRNSQISTRCNGRPRPQFSCNRPSVLVFPLLPGPKIQIVRHPLQHRIPRLQSLEIC